MKHLKRILVLTFLISTPCVYSEKSDAAALLRAEISIQEAKLKKLKQRLAEIDESTKEGDKITISPKSLQYGSQPITPRGLTEKLKNLDSKSQITIVVDKATKSEEIIKVLNICREADIWNVVFETN